MNHRLQVVSSQFTNSSRTCGKGLLQLPNWKYTKKSENLLNQWKYLEACAIQKLHLWSLVVSLGSSCCFYILISLRSNSQQIVTWQDFYIYLLYLSELETCIVSMIYPFQTPAIWQNEVQSGHSRLQGRLAQDLKQHRMTGGDSETLTLAILQLDSDMLIIPIGSVYDIFLYNWLKSIVNIGKLCHTWIHCGIYIAS